MSNSMLAPKFMSSEGERPNISLKAALRWADDANPES
jgi:hypothetical protein